MAETIRSLAKAHAIIELLRTRGAMTPSEIADGVGVPRSSAYRLVEGLRAIDLVAPRTDGTVDLSQRWLHLADASRAARTEWDHARDVLAGIAKDTGFTAYLVVPRAGAGVCVDWVRGRGVELLILRPGGSLALNAGAASRALRAHLPVEERGEVVAYTPFTLTAPEALAEDESTIRAQGHVLAAEDITVGITSLGVPVLDRRGRATASLSVGGLSSDMRDATDTSLRVLQRAAAALGSG
jgi:DNA-binding IclR family transcriptional regulator